MEQEEEVEVRVRSLRSAKWGLLLLGLGLLLSMVGVVIGDLVLFEDAFRMAKYAPFGTRRFFLNWTLAFAVVPVVLLGWVPVVAVWRAFGASVGVGPDTVDHAELAAVRMWWALVATLVFLTGWGLVVFGFTRWVDSMALPFS